MGPRAPFSEPVAGKPCNLSRPGTASNLGASVCLLALFLALPAASVASEWRSVNSQTGFSSRAQVDRVSRDEVEVSGSGFVIRPFTRGAVSSLAGLRDLIADAEVREGYNSVQLSARIKPPKKPTHMRMKEVLALIDATPGQPHAIGRDLCRKPSAHSGSGFRP